jgi:hypothetical protein
MFVSAARPRKRSIRPLEWSGPMPSFPCGSSRTSDGVSPHLARPETKNSSITPCALLMKSPYCASQITSLSGDWTLYPISKPIAPASLNGLFSTSNEACACEKSLQGNIRFVGLRIIKYCVALAERAAGTVLSRQTDRDPILQDRCKGKILRCGPVHFIGRFADRGAAPSRQPLPASG